MLACLVWCLPCAHREKKVCLVVQNAETARSFDSFALSSPQKVAEACWSVDGRGAAGGRHYCMHASLPLSLSLASGLFCSPTPSTPSHRIAGPHHLHPSPAASFCIPSSAHPRPPSFARSQRRHSAESSPHAAKQGGAAQSPPVAIPGDVRMASTIGHRSRHAPFWRSAGAAVRLSQGKGRECPRARS